MIFLATNLAYLLAASFLDPRSNYTGRRPPLSPEEINSLLEPYNLKQKSNDQVELSLGWGQTGVIGRVGLKLNNFSMANLFRRNREHRGILPIGDGADFEGR